MCSIWLVSFCIFLKYLLIIENNNSKQGYQSNKTMKYGDIELLLKARFIKNKPENKDKYKTQNHQGK